MSKARSRRRPTTAPRDMPAQRASITTLPIDGSTASLETRPITALDGAPESEDAAPAPVAAARAADLIAPDPLAPWARYEDLGSIGSGGAGEVRRVRDRLMDRTLAMKILRGDAAASPLMRARFLAEARLSGRLQHPGIVPIHDCGAMPDGRLWFTMTEVRGQTLREVIAAAYAAEPAGLGEVELRRLVDVYARVCEAVAYAHRQGVIHRDLKPDNVLVGELGEVYVADWGIARPQGEADPAGPWAGRGGDRFTLAGRVIGTPEYMPPEQARGDRARIGAPSDVYALGAILYEILCGRMPYEGPPRAVLAEVTARPPLPLSARGRARPPEELEAICERAMERAARDRFPDAGALATEVRSFLDGARRRTRALALTREAEAIAPRAAALRARAAALRAEAGAALAQVQTWDPVNEKARGWALEDEARAEEVAAAVEQVAWEKKIHAALTEAPDLAEAHEALAAEHARELLAAEAARDAEAAARAEALLWLHDRGRFAVLLEGSGFISLDTDPPGASVTLSRYVERGRRLTAEPHGTFGETPLREVALLHGSYLLSIAAPGFREVRYPVRIGRAERWDGAPPGGAAGDPGPRAIPLLRDEALGPDDVYVPGGWFTAGGDRLAAESLPAQRIWVDGFVMRRHPVTVEEYLAFLNDLVSQGRDAEAEAACPCIPSSMAGSAKVALYPKGAGGTYLLPDTTPRAPRGKSRGSRGTMESTTPALREPAVSMTWHGAMAYAAWWAARTGAPWRLPSEIEREKAARGVDERHYPWGDHPESTWANVAGSAPGAPRIAPAGAHPLDESPYGILGLAGNTRDWCIDEWTPSGPLVEGGALRVRAAKLADPALRSVRGGAWTWPVSLCRAAARLAARPDEHGASLGLRLVRPVGAEVR